MATLRVLILGDARSGKTTVAEGLIHAYAQAYVKHVMNQTSGLARVNAVMIWDTDDERPHRMPHIVVVCFDLSLPNAMSSVVGTWLPHIHSAFPGAATVLVGTHLDRTDNPTLFVRDTTWQAPPAVPRALRDRVAAARERLRLLADRRPRPSRPMRGRVSPFDWLPDEVVLKILWFVPTYSLHHLPPVCRRFQRLLADPATFATPGRHDVPLRQIQQGRRLPDRAYKAAEGASGAKLHVDMSDSLISYVAGQWNVAHSNIYYIDTGRPRVFETLATAIARAPVQQAALVTAQAAKREVAPRRAPRTRLHRRRQAVDYSV